MDIDLNTDVAPDPVTTLKLAETLAEITRTLNRRTRHHEALQYPSEADRLLRELETMASRLPQLLGQAGAWLEQEQAAGRIRAEGGQYAGNPAAAVVAARLRLDVASTAAEGLAADLGAVAEVTSTLAAAETGDGGDDD